MANRALTEFNIAVMTALCNSCNSPGNKLRSSVRAGTHSDFNPDAYYQLLLTIQHCSSYFYSYNTSPRLDDWMVALHANRLYRPYITFTQNYPALGIIP